MRTITPDRFEMEVLRATDPVIVLFDASWCPFCRAFRPTMERHQDEFPWPVTAVLLDDTNDSLWDTYSIDVIPTLAVFESGRSVFKADGILGVGLGEKDIERLREYVRSRAASKS